MDHTLYFICPTDCLEPVIDNTFKQENYFYSSLGNATAFNDGLLHDTHQMITDKNIKEVTFVIANDNQIVLDALGNQAYASVMKLDHYYAKIQGQYHSNVSWSNWNDQFVFLSSLLSQQIDELKSKLANISNIELSISGKVYNREQNIFKDISSDLIYMGCSNF